MTTYAHDRNLISLIHRLRLPTIPYNSIWLRFFWDAPFKWSLAELFTFQNIVNSFLFLTWYVGNFRKRLLSKEQNFIFCFCFLFIVFQLYLSLFCFLFGFSFKFSFLPALSSLLATASASSFLSAFSMCDSASVSLISSSFCVATVSLCLLSLILLSSNFVKSIQLLLFCRHPIHLE